MEKLKDIANKIVNSRESKKKKIEEVSSILNIKLDFLRLIESGELSKIENNIYSRGHIRTYLDWLGIDPQVLLNFIDEKKEKKNKIKNQQNYFKIHKLTISKKYIILICIITLCLIIYSWNKLFLRDSNIIAFEIKLENIGLEKKIIQSTEKIKKKIIKNNLTNSKIKTSDISLNAISNSYSS
tara:strand:+ start:50 stop:598 length:549 start_codon:yes stop_codon:yes gene_type:complete